MFPIDYKPITCPIDGKNEYTYSKKVEYHPLLKRYVMEAGCFRGDYWDDWDEVMNNGKGGSPRRNVANIFAMEIDENGITRYHHNFYQQI